MKSVSTKFVDTLKRKVINVKRQVYYKRRYWVTSAYVWEAAWTALPETTIVSVSPITSQLDTQTQNEFSISNVTLILANLTKQWRPDNTSGYFAPDGVSSLGYEPYWTKVQVRAGLIFDDGTTEIITLFTGVVTDLNFNAKGGTVQMSVSGLQALLLKSNAEPVSTTVTNEAVGTGDGTTKTFFTLNKGVGIFTNVKIAGVVKSAGTDYTISNSNDINNFASINFVVAPASSAAITATYLYWKQSQKFETLVSLLLTQAGIPVGNQQVSSVIFPTNITNTHVWQTLADWNGGSSLTNIDTATIVNSIQFLYSTLSTINDSTSGWSSVNFGGTGTVTADSQGLLLTPGSDIIAYRSQSNVVGEWSTTFQESGTGNTTIYFYFMANTASSSTGVNDYFIRDGYRIIYNSIAVNPYIQVQVWSTSSGAWSTPASGTNFSVITLNKSNPHTIRVRRNGNGRIRVYLDGTLFLDVTDTTFTTSTYLAYRVSQTDPVHFNKTTAYLPPSSSVGTWISSSLDFTTTPTGWTPFLSTQTLNSGTVKYYTRGSPDNSTWDAWVAVSGGVVGSTLRRYLQVRADIDITSGDPSIASITAGALTASTVITLANFTAMTVYDAITQIASLANYEFGFDSSENFFFRQKKLSSTPLMTLDQSNYLSDILALTLGYDLVYTGVRSSYGLYTAEVDDVAGTPSAPTARFGYALFQPSSANFLIPADANLAANIAQNLFNYYNLPRKRVKVATKFLPQIDLSDVVQISFLDNPAPKSWYWGDSAVYWGMPGIYYYKDAGNLGDISALTGKVIGYRIDTENWSCEMDLEEVI